MDYKIQKKFNDLDIKPISLVITGQIKSRIEIAGGVEKIAENLNNFKKLHSENEIIISTFDGQQVSQIDEIVDITIINTDPGPDYFRVQPWPIAKKKSDKSANYTRMFTTAISGLSACKNIIVIKTRIELIPEDCNKFRNWLSICTNGIEENSNNVGLFTEHYNGIIFSIDGTLGTLPATLLISEKSNLLKIYTRSKQTWDKHFLTYTRKKFLFPVIDEQILGLSYLSIIGNFKQDNVIHKIKRYYISRELIIAIQKTEKYNLIFTKYSESGFTKNYFVGSSYITIPDNLNSQSRLQIIFALIIIVLKRYKHLSRRLRIGLKKRLEPRFKIRQK